MQSLIKVFHCNTNNNTLAIDSSCSMKDCQNVEGYIGAGIDKKDKEKILNVRSENHWRFRPTSNSFFQVRRHTFIVLEELEGCDTSELSLDVKEEVEDVDSNIHENKPEDL